MYMAISLIWKRGAGVSREADPLINCRVNVSQYDLSTNAVARTLECDLINENTMKLALILTSSLLMSTSAFANPALAEKKSCLACHAVDAKRIGPSYKDVAVKYADNKDAVAMLATKIRKGGGGVWGSIPMPANPQVTEAEAKTLAQWVLTLK